MDRLRAGHLRDCVAELGPGEQLVDEPVDLDLVRDLRGDALYHLALDDGVRQLLGERPGEHGVDDAGALGAGENVLDGRLEPRARRAHRDAGGVEGNAAGGGHDPVVAVWFVRGAASRTKGPSNRTARASPGVDEVQRIARSLRWRRPLGVSTSTVSPGRWPTSARPTGDSTDRRPRPGSTRRS